ncbi:glucose PTS transporter subunit IIA [Propioniciclava tarda]|uniref:PTS beta-glucoside transporter subunit EIIBCA n=1 Tax=Propioniciclava tarda TaxID=433330 RepID=A0A4Q9KKR0_PROTD|nr:glucose PTS transporter subunit IIA [Propioniciclava tarda]TBT95028.1 PTS beta-glucoside transporter subunit EIIBCA [Propioniciclava tarda]SMO54112.1 PTS system IIA component, Glc family /PTS system IIB component, Glc family /PTS system IIC component, Glc family [Propioniciclava tarda]
MATSAEQIVDAVGGPGNIRSLTHCATRLRFELNDASKVVTKTVESIPGVMGAVPQSGDRYQIVIGGAVQSYFSDIMALPAMKSIGSGRLSDADVKAAERAKARGKFAWLDAFFEYLSDSFRPLLGVLLGGSLIIAIAAVLDAFHIVPFQGVDRAKEAGASWIFWDSMWRAVLYFLPVMVAYNAAKKLKVDPWLGATVMAALFTPEYMSLSNPKVFPGTVCTTNPTLGTDSCVAQIFGLPMQLNGYGGQVFVPLIMVAVLALVYRFLKKIFPENIQMVFVPFFSMLIMIPVTAFLIGPLGIWLGTGLGSGLAWLNGNAPILFAIIIPLLYPFLVPLGLHWPLNALMLANIASAATNHQDFIQGPMGSWNFACFGATAGVLYLTTRNKNRELQQTAIGALAAGLLGGISEPSLYGIHLRYKRIYPRMLIGCLVGGLVTGILGWSSGGVKTGTFAFTSLLTIPVFNPVWVYVIAITAAFFTAMILVIISDYRTPEQKAEEEAERAQEAADLARERELALVGAGSVAAPAAAAVAPAPVAAAPAASAAGTKTTIVAPVGGRVVALDDVNDKVFSSRVLGDGVGIIPTSGRITSPVSGVLLTVPKSGHAFGIKTDSGVEVLVHIGIDTVRLKGENFTVAVEKGAHVNAGDLLAEVNLDGIRAAGYDTTTMVTVTNTKAMGSVTPHVGETVVAGAPVIDVVR